MPDHALTNAGSAASPWQSHSGTSPAVRARLPESGRSRVRLAMIRTGWRAMPRSRTVSVGSSARAVPPPTITASWRARCRCTMRRASGPVIHWLSPVAVAIRPSKLLASFRVTIGRPSCTRFRKPAWARRASDCITPVVTVIPASRKMACPLPATRGSGSSSAVTTRATPALISDSAQGGVLPWWAQGSNVT